MYKCDIRTCRILNWVTAYAETRLYNGYCRTIDGKLAMLNRYPFTAAGEGLFPHFTLEEVIHHFFYIAGKAFDLDRNTITAYETAMWDTRDGGIYIEYPTLEIVDSYM